MSVADCGGTQRASILMACLPASNARMRQSWQNMLAMPVPGTSRPWLGRSRWDAAAAWYLVRDYVVEQLGDHDGVFVVDETRFLQKGDKPAGVAR